MTDAAAGQAPAPSAPAGGDAQTERPKQQSGGGAASSLSPAATGLEHGHDRRERHSTRGLPGGSFPKDDPIFRLTSLKGTARVGIVGGGYANGAPTITLEKGGKPVTLMNTADGTTYVLRYVG